MIENECKHCVYVKVVVGRQQVTDGRDTVVIESRMGRLICQCPKLHCISVADGRMRCADFERRAK